MKRLTLVLLLPLLGLMVTSAHAETTMSQSVLGSGGVMSSGPSYRLDATLAQPVIGVVTGGHRIDIGYWQVLGLVTSDAPPPPQSAIERFATFEIAPNPLQPGSEISLLLPARAHVSVKLYDVTGRVRKDLVDADLGPGIARVALPVTNLPSGVYLCRMTAPGVSDTKRLVLLRGGR
ncbi:MAG: T9SS type A sorting domain-containing protein [Candidatus Eisenbacteria bacterium]